jgi:hypothetical protein
MLQGHYYPTLKIFAMKNSAYSAQNTMQMNKGWAPALLSYGARESSPCSCLMPCYLSMITLVLYTVANSGRKENASTSM